jgi:hypothetical protein
MTVMATPTKEPDRYHLPICLRHSAGRGGDRRRSASMPAECVRSVVRLASVPERISRETMLGFPEHDFDHRKTTLPGVFKDQPGDILRCRIAVHHENTLSALTEHRQEGIVLAQQHVVIQVFVNPLLDRPLDIGEIDQHPPLIELRSLQGNHRTAIVTVEMTTLAVIV